ncbi:ATP-binding protein [Aureivirga sp. CE67]|uniref:ATP-binding protein n=1 Tax=Aureivirga sp. CE67 TaxID=1788983 RepID=UPI0018C9A99F|nr:ATP-binding protein [Aureivirga sp. CE67]
MTLKELVIKFDEIVKDFKDYGYSPKENNLFDYKMMLVIKPNETEVETFMKNFAKDIISFANGQGGIILIGFQENKITGEIHDKGLEEVDQELLKKLDLNLVSQKFKSILQIGISIDLQPFQIATRKFYSLLIQKSVDTLIPVKECKEYKIKKGDIYYRDSAKNEHANSSSSEFNRFLQLKANEKSKEFMEIWSNLLPEMVDINPREVLIVNPNQNKIYGFNGKDKKLAGSNVEIDKSKDGVFNIILNAISAGEIGKISDTEGKPIYKIVGEIKRGGDHMTISSLEKVVKEKTKYKFTNVQLKCVIHYLGWVNDANFKVEKPPKGTIQKGFDKYLWEEILDQHTKRSKIVFTQEAKHQIINIVEDKSKHQKIFGKELCIKE